MITLELRGHGIERSGELQQGGATTRNNSLLHCGARGIESVFDTQFAVLQLRFGGSAYFDHRHAAGQFGDPFGQLLAVVFRFGVLQLATDGGHTVSHGGLTVFARHDRGVFFADGDSAGASEVLKRDLVEGHGLVFADDGATGQDGDVSQCCLASLAK